MVQSFIVVGTSFLGSKKNLKNRLLVAIFFSMQAFGFKFFSMQAFDVRNDIRYAGFEFFLF